MKEHLSPTAHGGSLGTDSPPVTDLPLAAGTWVLDASHSGVDFKVRHLGLSNVRGRFNHFDATLTVGETLAETWVEATIDVSSVDTNRRGPRRASPRHRFLLRRSAPVDDLLLDGGPSHQ